LQGLFWFLALFFLLGIITNQWQELQHYEWHLDPSLVGLAFTLLTMGSLAEIALWRYILLQVRRLRRTTTDENTFLVDKVEQHGASLRSGLDCASPFPKEMDLGRAAQIWFLSNAARYIPGNVWQFVGMLHLCAKEGISKTATLTSIVIHQALSNLTGLLLAGAYFLLTRQNWPTRLEPLFILVLLALVLIHPAVLQRLLNAVLTRLRRSPIVISLRFSRLLLLSIGYGLVWTIYGSAFAALATAVTSLSWPTVPHLVATFIGAYVMGYLSLLTPSGLGVREGIMIVLLEAILPLSAATVVAILSRLWLVLFDLIAAGLSLVTGGLSSNPRSREATHVS